MAHLRLDQNQPDNGDYMYQMFVIILIILLIAGIMT